MEAIRKFYSLIGRSKPDSLIVHSDEFTRVRATLIARYRQSTAIKPSGGGVLSLVINKKSEMTAMAIAKHADHTNMG